MKTFAEILQALAGDDLASSDAETLAAWRDALRDGVLERASLDEIDTDTLAEIREGKAGIEKIDAETERREALNDELDGIVSELSDDSDEDEEEETVEETEDKVESDEETDEEDGDEVDEEEKELEAVSAAAPIRRRRSAAELEETSPATPPGPATLPAPRRWTAAAGVSGMAPGDEFEDSVAIAAALMDRFDDIRGGGNEKIAVANLKGEFTEEMELVKGDHEENMRRLGGGDPTRKEAVTASLACVPRQPLYDVGIDSSTARPVQASLPRRRAPRGGYLVYPHPVLADVLDAAGSGDGTGIWTETEDDDPEAVKNACAVITCSTPIQYDIYGVYRCITVRNLLNMTFPELVDAYLNKLTALWARLAETTLLDAMIGSTNTLALTEAVNTDYSVNQNLIDLLNRAVSVYREQERYGSVEFDCWLPRWVQRSLISDAAFLTKFDSSLAARVATEADVSAVFNDMGITPHWTLDTATGWQSIAVQGAGALQDFPTEIDLILSPRGNFQHLDQGTLQVGVTNRGQPWDLDDMARNQFTMFWESYEGLLDLGAPTWTLTITGAAPTGQQLLA